MSYTRQYIQEIHCILNKIDINSIEILVNLLYDLRSRNGRLFCLGLGGSAANCSHAANDFRKIAGIEAYTPTDNISEFTARINDEGWINGFVACLKASRLTANDMLFILSVGGGDFEKNISANIVTALQYAKLMGTKIIGIVGRDGGYTAQVADACVIIPTVNDTTVTVHTEALQSVIWHLLVSHPILRSTIPKWESIS